MKKGLGFYFLDNERWGLSFQGTDGFPLFYHKFRGQSILYFFEFSSVANAQAKPFPTARLIGRFA